MMDKTLLDSISVYVFRLKRLPVAEYANIVSVFFAQQYVTSSSPGRASRLTWMIVRRGAGRHCRLGA